MVLKEQRVGVFVDVQNQYYSAKNLYNAKVNFANILKTEGIDPGATGWLLYESQHTIAYKETKKIPILVKVPVEVEPGSYVYNIYVNDGDYGLTKITVVIP